MSPHKSTHLELEPSQLGLIQNEKTLELLPSAKVKPVDKSGVHGWTKFYAAFSESFVDHALSALNIDEKSVVVDPFVGSGTTLVACLQIGCDATGVDLDPFSCLLSRAKIAIKPHKPTVKKLLRTTSRKTASKNFSDSAYELFDFDCLCYASSVISRISNSIKCDKSEVLQTLLDDTNHKFDSEVIALTALCIGASESANLVRGSNPTWYRKGLESEKDNIKALLSVTAEITDKMLEDLKSLSTKALDCKIKILNCDVTKGLSRLKKQGITHVITSPPYLTRMDYVVKHLPHLLILGGATNLEIENLRNRMIGTPKIVQKGEIDSKWGPLCNDALTAIGEHSSYASSSYYVWTYYQYFQSLYESLVQIISILIPGGKGLLVVQDSYYKDVHVPLGEIAIEMLENVGAKAKIVRRENVSRSLKQLNPAHSKRNIKPAEDAIFFEKSDA